MIIDMHTHMFPEKIAASTIQALEKSMNIKPNTNGMASGLLESMKEAGVDLSVVLPVVTKPSQFERVNQYALQFQEGPILSFGGIHPDSDSYKEELRKLKQDGFKGIKLHPDYQGVAFDSLKMKRLIDYASELGFVIVTHAGNDPAYPDKILCTPQMIREVLCEVQPEKLVLAHMGGDKCMDEMEEYVLGRNVYLDTAYILRRFPQERMIRMFRAHSCDKILFATDSPWSSQKDDVDYMKMLPLTEEEKTKILSKNAEKLLDI